MNQPLEPAYNWRTPVMVSTVGLFACGSVLVGQRAPGWLPVLVTLIGCWLVLLGVVWSRTRAYLAVAGPTLTVRRFRTRHRLSGAEVTAVRQVRTLTGPGYRLDTATGSHLVPTALLRDGTPTLLRWLVGYAPEAHLDPATAAAIDRLRTQGLVD